MSKSAGSMVMFILIGCLLGGYAGVLLGLIIPTGLIHDIVAKEFALGFDNPVTFDLKVIILSFGFKIVLNIFSFFGMVLGLYFAK